jgi:hypothetical protein
MTAPLTAREIAALEKMLRRHPGAQFSFFEADEALPRSWFSVGLPCEGVPFGRVHGSASTLDGAFYNALARLDDALGNRKAA